MHPSVVHVSGFGRASNKSIDVLGYDGDTIGIKWDITEHIFIQQCDTVWVWPMLREFCGSTWSTENNPQVARLLSVTGHPMFEHGILWNPGKMIYIIGWNKSLMTKKMI